MSPDSTNESAGRLGNFLLSLGALALCVVLLELSLWAAGYDFPVFLQYDEELGRSLIPGSTGYSDREGRGLVEINSAGFRDPEWTVAREPDVVRVAVLGDSFTEARQVDYGERYTEHLAAELERCLGAEVEVLNFGVAGYGTGQQWLLWRRVVKVYRPDLVILGFYYGNDVGNNLRETESDQIRPFFELDGERLVVDYSFRSAARLHSIPHRLSRLLSRHSRAFLFVRRRMLGQPLFTIEGSGVTTEDFRSEAYLYRPPEPGTAWARAWRVTEAILARLADDVRSTGAELLLVSLSNPEQVLPRPEVRRALVEGDESASLFYAEERLSDLAAAEGFRYLPLAPEMQELADAEGIFFHGFDNTAYGRGHWNRAAHRFAGRRIGETVCNHDMIQGHER